MRENTYKKMLSFFENHSFFKKLITVLGKGITICIYIFYPLFLFFLYLIKHPLFLKILLVPLISFAVLSIIRRLINSPRPYEKYDIKPLYSKSTKGCSFPSRHTFSAFIIALVSFLVNAPLGIALVILAVALAISRVLCGIHFIKDVVAGFLFALISFICGMLF